MMMTLWPRSISFYRAISVGWSERGLVILRSIADKCDFQFRLGSSVADRQRNNRMRDQLTWLGEEKVTDHTVDR